MPRPTSIYADIIEGVCVGDCIEFSQHDHGGKRLTTTDINTIRALVNRLNARQTLSTSRLCVRSSKEFGAVQVYRIPKFAEEYVQEVRSVKQGMGK